MRSITLLILLISSLALAFADAVPKWNTSCPFAANVSANIWQPTNLTLSPTPPPFDDGLMLTVCGIANQDFIPDQWNATGVFILSSTDYCWKEKQYFVIEDTLTTPNVTAGDEYCSDILVAKSKEVSGVYMNWITTVILNDSQNRNLGCLTINDIIDDNFDKNCPTNSAFIDEIISI